MRVSRARRSETRTTMFPAWRVCMDAPSTASNQARIQSHTPIRIRSGGSSVQLTGICTTSALAMDTVSVRAALFQAGAAFPSARTRRNGSRSGQAELKLTRVTEPGRGWTSERT